MSLNYTWLPAAEPEFASTILQISSANGSYLIDSNGEFIYDAISSWWCKPLGHRHALIQESIKTQLQRFEHHIPANAYNDNLEQLSLYLIQNFSTMDKVMYASDGSSAVEIALKLSYETRMLSHEPQRNKFIALADGYHGETIFTLGVCGIPSYKEAYARLIPSNYFITPIVYVSGTDDPLWHKCNFNHAWWRQFFTAYAPTASGLIFEPIVQGAGGIKIISRDFLIQLITLAREFGLHIIADEIMVGLGRLGCLAVTKEILGVEPDLVCFAKNLTAGSIPMSAVVINRSISSKFSAAKHAFPHSHTHSCNGLATAVALNYLKLLKTSNLLIQVQENEIHFKHLVIKLAAEFPFIYNCRNIGALAAFDLNLPAAVIAQIYHYGLKAKIYLRPIANTVYIMPPLNNLSAELPIIYEKLQAVFKEISLKDTG
jgi:adenosylmethionine-8-amino-7-oxononanoate aminotransferase